MEVYSLYVNDEEYEVIFSLKELYERYLQTLSTRDFDRITHFFGYSHGEFNGKCSLTYGGEIFNKRELSEEEVKEIEKFVDKKIDEAEIWLKKIGGVACSGIFVPCRADRERYIASEILRASITAKTFEELDLNLLQYRSLNK